MYIKKCANCSGLNHYKNECENNLSCKFSSEKHDSQACPHKDDIEKHKCINCFKSSTTSIRETCSSHNATDQKCPVFLEFQNRLIRNTLWSTNPHEKSK